MRRPEHFRHGAASQPLVETEQHTKDVRSKVNAEALHML
jgi:hypothetical protein